MAVTVSNHAPRIVGVFLVHLVYHCALANVGCVAGHFLVGFCDLISVFVMGFVDVHNLHSEVEARFCCTSLANDIVTHVCKFIADFQDA